MISPTRRSCRVMSASHSGQLAIAYVPPLSSCKYVKQQKRSSSSIPGKDEERSTCSRGTTFICQCLAASTSSSTTLLQPGYGGFRQRSTFAQSRRFLLAAPGFYSQCVDIRASHHSPALWTQQATATRPFKAFALCGCLCVSQDITCIRAIVKDSVTFTLRREEGQVSSLDARDHKIHWLLRVPGKAGDIFALCHNPVPRLAQAAVAHGNDLAPFARILPSLLRCS